MSQTYFLPSPSENHKFYLLSHLFIYVSLLSRAICSFYSSLDTSKDSEIKSREIQTGRKQRVMTRIYERVAKQLTSDI